MRIQQIIRIVGRILFYTVLFLLLALLIFTLATDKWLPAAIIGVIVVIAIYLGLIRVRIPAYSVVVQAGKVIFFIPEATVRNRFDFASRGQTIIELPYYALLDRPYKLELFARQGEGVSACRLILHLDYVLEDAAYQKAYDSFANHGEKLSLEVRRLLWQSAAKLETLPQPQQDDVALQVSLQPLVALLNSGLSAVGLKIEAISCTFGTAATMVRFVAPEQESVEKGLT